MTHIEHAECWLAEDPNGLKLNVAKQLRLTLQNQLKISLSNTSAISYTPDELGKAENEWDKLSKEFFNDVSFRVTS